MASLWPSNDPAGNGKLKDENTTQTASNSPAEPCAFHGFSTRRWDWGLFYAMIAVKQQDQIEVFQNGNNGITIMRIDADDRTEHFIPIASMEACKALVSALLDAARDCPFDAVEDEEEQR